MDRPFFFNKAGGSLEHQDSEQIHERFRKYAADISGDDDAAKKAAGEGACRDLEYFVISRINQKFGTYIEKDQDFFEDLFQAGMEGIIQSLSKYDPGQSKPTTYFSNVILHEMNELTNNMKHDTKPYVTTLKRKIQQVDRRFEIYGRTPALHDYVHSIGVSYSCVIDVLAQMKTNGVRVSMDDPDNRSLIDQMAGGPGPEEIVASKNGFDRIIQIAREIEPDEAIVQCFIEDSEGEKTARLAEKYHRSPWEITEGIFNLKNRLKNHEDMRRLYPEYFRTEESSPSDPSSCLPDRIKRTHQEPKQNFMTRTDLCYLYDTVYSGQSRSILHEVKRSMLSHRDIGFLCRYACEYYLRWGPKETMEKLSMPVLRLMKLDNLVGEMKLPPEISPPERQGYLFYLMYPEYFGKYPKELFVTAIYQSVFAGQRKGFPRSFFSGGYGGEENSRICLMYALETMGGCHTPEDCVRLMSSRQAVPFLRKARLYNIMKRKFKSPVVYVRDALMMTGMLKGLT